MRYLLLTLLFSPLLAKANPYLGILSSSVTSISSTNTLTNNLVAYWKMDEVSGNRADSWTNSITLTDNGSIGSAQGVFPPALFADFEANNSQSLTTTSTNVDFYGAQSFSGQVWIKFESHTTDMYLASIYNTTGNQRQWALRYLATTNRFNFGISLDGSSSVSVYANNAGGATNGVFTHIVWWYNSTNSTIGISVNNSTETSSTGATNIFNSTSTFIAGQRTGNADRYDGLMGELTLWSRVLTTNEISTLYNNGSGYQIPLN